MATDIVNEAGLAQDIEQLRERFTHTQALYREVCALLFFRYGITPTANKLYQLVRKGSMSAPADALTKFWEDLREKSRTRIEHPDLPEALKTAAGDLIADLWGKAQVTADESLGVYRAEARVQVEQAHAQVVQSQAKVDAANSDRKLAYMTLESIKEELNRTRLHVASLEEKSLAADRSRASLETSLEEARKENTALVQQLNDGHQKFSAQIDKLRAAMELADERSRSAEKRALLDADRERVAATRIHKELELHKIESSKIAERYRIELAAIQGQLGELRQTRGQLEGKLQAVGAERDLAMSEINHLQGRLNDVGAQAAVFQAQADEWRRKSQELQQQLLSTPKKVGKNAQRPRAVPST
ncbi:DNA-binding protein [Candidimonas sp. SYP-B2681]|uniref:DNA-binding protein n=1 Tax=Candidimonas sp. SYP-B2681 TaxID=2497686 RepID=UPI000F89AB4A|nr:DNA-binding protein [Candidimonas sp. SYP-B2681]RTZ48110.1 DNA-binding protein [Candidimonas sp. SYP-B2681]